MKIYKTITMLSLLLAVSSCAVNDQKENARQHVKDASITRTVKSVFDRNPELRSREIRVETLNSGVTLSGVVNTEKEKGLAQQEALTVEDVEAVHNKLIVRGAKVNKHEESPKEIAEDTEITTKIKLALVEHPELSAYQIKVDTRKSTVYLSGVVSSRAEALKAESLALDTKGVQGVKNQLKIQR